MALKVLKPGTYLFNQTYLDFHLHSRLDSIICHSFIPYTYFSTIIPPSAHVVNTSTAVPLMPAAHHQTITAESKHHVPSI